MSTAHHLYQKHPLGFTDFGTWMRHHERAYAEITPLLPDGHGLRIAFGAEWLELWLGVQELLSMHARVDRLIDGEWIDSLRATFYASGALRMLILFGAADKDHGFAKAKRRVVLLDGTIIKEWP